ncbi:hypothetical protein SDC9_09156 [bioreactor metagenome]|uniref:DZANK-type domain-containing protein n=1 Tax=bioreactor metagenome TaxID=1076179 RepID=A0A644T9P7_9ZZZZ|nr:zinc ribbon domain-containing protein [Negativicutes bacterium]
MVSIGFLIAFMIAFWVFNDARKRGHEIGSALLWSIGTCALVVLVLPLYLMFGRRPQVNINKDRDVIDIEATVVSESSISCTMCGHKVNDDFNVCPYCGFTLRPKCKECGHQLSRSDKNCPNCQLPTDLK